MSPPLHPPFPSKFYTKTATFSPFPLPRPILMRIFAALNNDSNLSRRAAVIAQRRLRGLFFMPIIEHTWRLPFRNFEFALRVETSLFSSGMCSRLSVSPARRFREC